MVGSNEFKFQLDHALSDEEVERLFRTPGVVSGRSRERRPEPVRAGHAHDSLMTEELIEENARLRAEIARLLARAVCA
jgi:hypothetical protein